MLLFFPRAKLSKITTFATSVRSNSATTWLPMNPAPPITKTRFPLRFKMISLRGLHSSDQLILDPIPVQTLTTAQSPFQPHILQN